ncbi:SirA-like protein, partial [Haemophilus influenzae]
KKNLSLS